MESAKREIITTGDGSQTVSIPELGITYHSTRGAVQESQHVFIEAGLQTAISRFPEGEITVFEMGFGTGLNALLTAQEAARRGREIHYIAVEQYPLNAEDVAKLSYATQPDDALLFQKLHEAEWEKDIELSPFVRLRKMKADVLEIELPGPIHAVYYDAFAPDAQPQLWTEALFRKLFNAMAEGGLLTTYCSKGTVRRAMAAAGFTIKKIPGPPGKREMVQAFKLT